MKKFLLSLLALLTFSAAYADEGMWLLKLMKEQHLEDSLKKAGLQISPSELYNETQPSLRDVIGRFGGGCTGEVVSSKGLVFTNNHCGFSYVHAMSTMQHNYLQDGFLRAENVGRTPRARPHVHLRSEHRRCDCASRN